MFLYTYGNRNDISEKTLKRLILAGTGRNFRGLQIVSITLKFMWQRRQKSKTFLKV